MSASRASLLRAVGTRGLAEVALFAAFAIFLTWPLATTLMTALPLGTERTPVVPLFSLWNLWWNADRVAELGAAYWQAPIFYPHRDVLAFSEPLLAEAWAVAPLWWLRVPPALAYNVVLLGALTLNGLCTSRLLRALRLGPPIAVFGGLCVEGLPFVQHELGVLPLLPLFPVIWLVYALLRLKSKASIGGGVRLGLAFALTYLCCNQYALFSSVLLLVVGVPWLAPRLLPLLTERAGPQVRRARRLAAALVVSGLVAAACTAPVVSVQLRAKTNEGLERRLDVVQRLSARPVRYLRPTWPLFGRLRGSGGPRTSNGYWPGPVKTLLALLGIALAAKRSPRRRFAVFAVALGAVSVVLSFGAELRVGRFVPYTYLAAVYPGFSQVRSVFRFAVFAELAVCLLAALGLSQLHARLRRSGRGESSRAPELLCGAVALAAIIEVLPPQTATYRLPPLASEQPWIGWLERHTSPSAPLVFLPFVSRARASAFEHTTEWMYFQTWHRRPLVNGYSSYFPTDHVELSRRLARVPAADSVAALRALGVQIIAVDRRAPGVVASREELARSAQLELAFRDPASGVELYRLR